MNRNANAVTRESLETERVSIEQAKNMLKLDCQRVSSLDTIKLSNCKKRQHDIKIKMNHYKNNLALWEECQNGKKLITKYQRGIRRIDANMKKNEKMIEQAQKDKKSSLKEIGTIAGDLVGRKAADILQARMGQLLKTKKKLHKFKKGLDEIEKLSGSRKRSRKLSQQRIAEARKWIDDGIKYGDKLADITLRSIQYAQTPGQKGSDLHLKDKMLKTLKDFNEQFMDKAGGWEFVGENLAKYGGGPMAKLAFTTAVAGIKTEISAANYLIRNAEIGEFQYNQGKLQVERSKLLYKIKKLKKKCSVK